MTTEAMKQPATIEAMGNSGGDIRVAHYMSDAKMEEYISNLEVTEEQYEVIDSRIHIAAREPFAARNLLPIKKLAGGEFGIGKQTYEYDVLTEMSNAIISNILHEDTEDTINLTRTVVEVPIIQKEYRVTARNLSASNTHGVPLQTTVLDAASYRILGKEDDYLIDGWTKDGTNYEINGLYRSAGNTVGGATWGTATNISANIQTAIGTLLGVNILPPYNLTVHPNEAVDLFALIAGTGIFYADLVHKMINFSFNPDNSMNIAGSTPGKIFISQGMTAGTAMLTKAGDHPYFEYHLAADMLHYEEREPKSKDLWGLGYIVGVPVIYDANAIISITGIA